MLQDSGIRIMDGAVGLIILSEPENRAKIHVQDR
jgi:hypothetical protein